jgi:hypothetical protein
VNSLSFFGFGHWPALVLAHRGPQERANLKKLLLLAAFAVCFTPQIARAGDWNHNDPRHHRKIGATEMAAAGFGAAALLGIAGYLVLRRRGTN